MPAHVVDVLCDLVDLDQIGLPLLQAKVVVDFGLVVVGEPFTFGDGGVYEFELVDPVLGCVLEQVVRCIGGFCVCLFNEFWSGDLGPVKHHLVERTDQIPLVSELLYVRFLRSDADLREHQWR